MIEKQLKILAGRRNELIGRSDAQRASLVLQAQSMMYSLTALETGMAVVRSIGKKPAVLAGLVVGLILIKPRRLLKFVGTSVNTWKSWSAVAPIVQTLLSRCKQQP